MPAPVPPQTRAIPLKHNGKLIYIVTVSTGNQFIVRQTGRKEWAAWVDLEAMHAGRRYFSGSTLYELIGLLDGPDSPARQELWRRAKAA